MFCPRCAAQNLDGASFCRVCGANISLIPQALLGDLRPVRQDGEIHIGGRVRNRYGRREPSLDHVFKNVFMGIAFLLVSIALAFSRMGGGWWFWMLIPAFSMMGTGIAQYIRLKEQEKRAFLPGNRAQAFQSQRDVAEIPARPTGELVPPPPSVTEGTTRHLGAESPTRHLDD
ncbi:MAG TPA: zinc ribbon domain-containing protein [Pyrinomonadaceae bacterium]|nr:zinc ribbon domain-containing protein [Pyrinomonadaceae bacterium]